jgi:uncharacterized membrane-anchored protein
MIALCRRFRRSPPQAHARWARLDVGSWQLRWERHSEFSSWTFFCRGTGKGQATALDEVPEDWIDMLPGPVLAFCTLAIGEEADDFAQRLDPHDALIASDVLGGAARVVTDLRADSRGMTRFDLVMRRADPIVTGRLALSLLEIETYRLMALLAFPLAGETAVSLKRLEDEAGELAARLADNLGVDDDRALLTRLVGLSGEAEALNARTSFRFGAAQAYYEIVRDRIASLQEQALGGMQTLGAFMDRRLGPAMRTCQSVAEREAKVIDRLARAGQMLNTRVELVTQEINAGLLASMDARARAQLQLQHTVEGLSVVAVTYYALSLLTYPLGAIAHEWPWFDSKFAAGIIAIPLFLACWAILRRIQRGVGKAP